jgi:hypothetical protein
MKTSRRQSGPGTDVFINCPFDEDYQPVFRAVVFAIRACGLNPRCALEIDDGAEVRVEKIIRIMRGCPLSVHDISRTALDRSSKLPRFNMPFELGLFIGLARGAGKRRPSLILDTERYRYQQFISDIAGQDIRAHAGDPLRAITHIRDWLNTLFPSVRLMGGQAFGKLYQQFTADLPKSLATSRLTDTEITFVDWSWLIADWLNVNQHRRGA